MARKSGPRATPASERQSGSHLPLRFGGDPLLWAAWLYYEEGMTQGDIAVAMGISRPTVNAYLADARTRGIVSIEIAPEKFRQLSLAQSLKEHFGLADCLVIPSTGGERTLTERLGAAGAQVLALHAQSGDTIAVTWGRTMLAIANAVERVSLRDMRVVQATGGTTAKIPWTPEACATRLAEALDARCIPLSSPAILSSPAVRDVLFEEPVIAEQLGVLAAANRILLGISSLRAESTIHTSGFFDKVNVNEHYHAAVGSIAGRLINARGEPVAGPLDGRTVGIELAALRAIHQRIAVAGGIDKVQAILAALRGGYVSVLVTDVDTAWGILRSENVEIRPQRMETARSPQLPERVHTKKFINRPQDAVDETLASALLAHPEILAPVPGAARALRSVHAPRPGKVGLVIGGGAGHEPGFFGYVGRGLADAVVVGNVFAAPPPDPILACTRAVDTGAGVLHIFGNFSGDVMNFEIAAERAAAEGIDVQAVVTTDDIASSPREMRATRRGVAGNVFIFKIAGAACDRMLPLESCVAAARRANQRTFTMGLALEPGASIETRRPTFQLGPDEMEIGVGVHGEPGIARAPIGTADQAADLVIDRLLDEMMPKEGDRVALLVNSLGATPDMELYILNGRIRKRLKAHGLNVTWSLVGRYYTSLDMAGVSISLMHLDDELADLLDAPCSSVALSRQ